MVIDLSLLIKGLLLKVMPAVVPGVKLAQKSIEWNRPLSELWFLSLQWHKLKFFFQTHSLLFWASFTPGTTSGINFLSNWFRLSFHIFISSRDKFILTLLKSINITERNKNIIRLIYLRAECWNALINLAQIFPQTRERHSGSCRTDRKKRRQHLTHSSPIFVILWVFLILRFFTWSEKGRRGIRVGKNLPFNSLFLFSLPK